jgi:hypothetical protein
MRKMMLICAFAALGTIGLSATEASAKGWGGGGWGGGWGHHGGWGGHWGGPRYFGGYGGYGFAPRCRWVPGYAGWVRVCR